MGRVKVSSKIKIYEIDGKDTPMALTSEVEVRSHWNWLNFVELVMPDGKVYTVSGSDLCCAVANAKNSGGV